MTKFFCKKIDASIAICLFLIFLLFQHFQVTNNKESFRLPEPPKNETVFSFNFSEPRLLARTIMLWLQTFDSQSGKIIQYYDLDYSKLIKWLTIVRELNPSSQYSLLTATHLFTNTKDKKKIRQILVYIEDSFKSKPASYWRWQAYAIILAKHRLNDIEYALKLSQDLNQMTKNSHIDHWARDMEFLLLEDLGEFEASALMIKNLLESGEISDARELSFLTRKLKSLKNNSQ